MILDETLNAMVSARSQMYQEFPGPKGMGDKPLIWFAPKPIVCMLRLMV